MVLLRALPNLVYNFGPSPIDPKFILTKNIWRRSEILREYKSSIVLFDEYIVQNGEKPEDLALKFYDNPFYNWVFFVINDIVNYHEQWPRSTQQLQEYCSAKYENPSATKDYVTYEVKNNGTVICPAGKVVPSTFSIAYWNGSTTVTANPVVSRSFYQYEEEVNAQKEKIQVVRKEYIEDFVERYLLGVQSGADLEIGIDRSGMSMD